LDVGAKTDSQRRQVNNIRDRGARIYTRIGEKESYETALNITMQGLALEPNNSDLRTTRAQANLGLGNHRQAIEDTTRAVEINEEDERAYMIRSLANYQMKNYAQALEDANKALAINPNNQTAYRIAKLTVGRITTADDMGLNAAQKAAAEKMNREYESMIQQQNQFEAQPPAAPAAPKTLSARGGPPRAGRVLDSLNMQAQSKIKLGDPRSAIALTNKVLQRAPENVNALYTRAAAENLMGQYEHAVEDATAVLHQDPHHPLALDARSLALANLGRPQEALIDADRSIAINPQNPYAYKNRAKAKEGLGDIAGMIADYQTAARLSPQFDGELQAIAKKYRLMLDPAILKELDSPGALASAKSSKKNNRPFLIVMASSITGGLLIAFGLVHILLGARRERKAAAIRNAGTRTVKALASPGLDAGYNIVKEIGKGGMGVVYAAVDKALNRKVAIKKMREEIHDDPRERERFLTEARIVAGLHHTNIVDIHNIIEDGGDLYMIFEFVEGSTLDQILAKKRRLSISEAQFIVRGVTSALSYAHQKGVIHRDLKPSNIMITKEGVVKVMDFGIARQAQDALAASTKTNTVAGTPHYMAPEQERGIVRKESDIFALGACLYEVLTGERPFPSPATTDAKINKRYAKPSRVAGNLPPQLDALIDAALEPDPDKRIHTASDFRNRLDAIKSTNEPLA